MDRNSLEKVISIPSNNVGRLIGPRGANIKRLQTETNTNIKIDKTSDGESTSVTISGDTQVDINAALKLLERFSNNMDRRSSDPYEQNYSKKTDHYDNSRRGDYDNHNNNSKKSDFYDNSRRSDYDNHNNNSKKSDFYDNSRRSDYDNHNNNSKKSDFYDQSNSRKSDFYEHSNSRDSSSQRDNSNSMEITVPKSIVGKIIGKSGETIRWLQDESNARIKIDNDQNFSSDDSVKVKIFGGKVSIDSANRLINEIIDNGRCASKKDDYADPNPREVDESRYAVMKNFYTEHPDLVKLSQEDRQKILDEFNILISRVEMEKGSVYECDILTARTQEFVMKTPVTSFEHALHQWPELLNEVIRQGFTKPSPIQSMMWPCLFSGQDAIGVAQTGSGKTLSFLFPAFVHLTGQKKKRENRAGPSVLILAPTRELAIQLEKEVKKYSYKDIASLCVYGGVEKLDQVRDYYDLRPEILVGTPGRVQDMLQSKIIILDDTTFVVLDEADRMLDMGFEPQILKILYYIGTDRQTVMTTATWPFSLKRVAYKFMIDPVQINIGTLDLTVCKDVEQTFQLVEASGDMYAMKKKLLFEILSGTLTNNLTNVPLFQAGCEAQKAIIFLASKSNCNYLMDEIHNLLEGKLRVSTIHGDMAQHDRSASLEDFRSGYSRILVATDLAARGLDIVDVSHVINFDFPKNIEEYIHRVGRTARAGRKGLAITFLSRRDNNIVPQLIKILREGSQTVPENLLEIAERLESQKQDPPQNFRRRY